MNPQVQSTTNYLVPAGGKTHLVDYTQVFSSAVFIDWRQFQIDNFPFMPQGVFIDNTQGTTALTITIQPLGYTISCPAGSILQSQFPAPDGQTCTINGTGQATVIFVDFPVMPGANAVNILGQVDVVFPTPQDIILNSISSGVVLSTTLNQKTLTPEYGSIAAAATSVTITPPANTNLIGIEISVSENATLAVAGTDLLTVTLNGVVIAKRNPYFPATVAAGSGDTRLFDRDFITAAPAVGSAGTLVVSLATALATGTVDVNAYFSD